MKIGILQADSVLPRFQAAHGDYPGMFEQVLRSAAGDDPLEVFTWRVTEGELPELDACDGYLITGSRESVYADLPWLPPLVDFVRSALEARRPVIGICFGHQLLAHFFGGRVGPAPTGWNVGVHTSRVVDRRPWMQPPLDELALLASHKDQVAELPAGAELIAAGATCPVAGFQLGACALAIQGHPEFQKGYSSDLMDMRRELLGEDVWTAGKASLDAPTDGEVVARWILNFVAAARAEARAGLAGAEHAGAGSGG
jgi:GMP synthase-like glutamine amidotransferase